MLLFQFTTVLLIIVLVVNGQRQQRPGAPTGHPEKITFYSGTWYGGKELYASTFNGTECNELPNNAHGLAKSFSNNVAPCVAVCRRNGCHQCDDLYGDHPELVRDKLNDVIVSYRGCSTKSKKN